MSYKLVASYEIAEYTIRFKEGSHPYLIAQETEIKIILKQKDRPRRRSWEVKK